jgi:SAM-dependent methyltransferase
MGCGDGILDICLARLGAQVTAVDRIGPVLEAAVKEVQTEKVEFIAGDLRNTVFEPGSFDLVLMLELVGLMSKADDASLIRKAAEWLGDSGQIVVDCPIAPGVREGQSQQELDHGTLQYRWTYDAASRLQHIVPAFRMKTGETIELHDPYDSSRPDHRGVLRYLYPRAELRSMLKDGQFRVREIRQPWRSDSYLLLGRRKIARSAAESGEHV